MRHILETIRYIESMPRSPWQFIVMFHDTCEFSIGHYPIICVRITWAHFTNTYLLIKKILHSSNSVAGFVITTNTCICHESTAVVVLEKKSYHFGRIWMWAKQIFHFFSIVMEFVHNSLWPSDAIWQHKSESTLAHVMACCLTAPSHYLNQSRLIILFWILHLSHQ